MLKIVVLCFVVAIINAQQVNDDILCEGRVFEPNCTVGTIQVITATFGRTDSWFCSGPQQTPPWSTNCAANVTRQVIESCQNRQTCSMRVQASRNNCEGAFQYLRVRWQCSGAPTVQAQVNNKNVNIMLSNLASRANPVPLHNQVVSGSDVYIFIDPPSSISQVRWYLDDMSRVFTTETAAPWDFLGGRAWNTRTEETRRIIAPRAEDGSHRIVATITFTDGTNGVVDATFTVRNSAGNNAGRATERNSNTYVENSNTVTVATENHVVPWSLFGTTVALIIALAVVIGVMDRKKKKMLERA